MSICSYFASVAATAEAAGPGRSPAGLLVLLLSAAAGLGAAETVGSAALEVEGQLVITDAGHEWCRLQPAVADPNWSFAGLRGDYATLAEEGRRFSLHFNGETAITGQTDASAAAAGAIAARWQFTATRPLDLACLAVSLEIASGTLTGGSWQVDGAEGGFPEDFGEIPLWNDRTSFVLITTPEGRSLRLDFAEPTDLLIQDNRQWSESFSLRIAPQAVSLAAGDRRELAMTISRSGGLELAADQGLRKIVADQDWLPLRTELDVVPGSALDLSAAGLSSGPCGAQGRLVVSADGRFVFADDPQRQPQRFYGPNLCFGAQYLSHQQVDQLCDRFVRLGYNTLRIHHYETDLTGGQPGLDWDPEQLDRLEYLIAACAERGLYITTDLYVSRPVSASQLGLPGEDAWAYRVKVLIPVHEGAYRDWQAFTRKLLERVNPHTGRRWADEPAIAWLSLINEGNVGNYWDDVKRIPEWTSGWNAWLLERYGDRAGLAAAWDAELAAEEDPAAASVRLCDDIWSDSLRQRDCLVYINEVETAMYLKMTRFLREEIGCEALFSNLSAWNNSAQTMLPRAEMDYVDDHFYVDHPRFLEQQWRLPSRCDNVNPLHDPWPARSSAGVRLLDKPFTVTEFNFSGPGRFRGIGGIMTGAMGALQDWSGIWRFAYSHDRDAIFEARPMNYFDLVRDPLNQAADRAAVMLFLREDLRPAGHTIVQVLTPAELRHPQGRSEQMGKGPNWVAWTNRFGSLVGDDPATVDPEWLSLRLGWAEDSPPGPRIFATDHAALLASMAERGFLPPGHPADPSIPSSLSDTGEIAIDATAGTLRFDTPRTAGGYLRAGDSLVAATGGLRIDQVDVDATVFATSLDGLPLRESRRILVTHLTDLQNSGITYTDDELTVLLDWGSTPHLVHRGRARVAVELADPAAWTVHALSTGGRRVGGLATAVVDGALGFTCDVAGPDGACLLYELSRD